VRQKLDRISDLAETEAGLHTVGQLGESFRAEAVALLGTAHKLELFPISRFQLKTTRPERFLLGFAAIDVREIRRGVERLASVLDSGRHSTA
jgi:DNA-binding transcriptional MocR family regulator